jgi:hypothetical protein
MKRCAGVLMLLAALGGCVSTGQAPPWGSSPSYSSCGGGQAGHAASVPGYQGPWGQPVAMAMPYAADPPGELAARAMLANSMPVNMVQQAGGVLPGNAPAIVPAGFAQAGPMPLPHQGPIMPVGHKAAACPPGPPVAGAVAAVGAVGAGGVGAGMPGGAACTKRTEVRFTAPAGMKVSWYTGTPDGKGGFGPNRLDVPGRYNFLQAAIYRLKLSDIPGRPGLELYPTLEVVPSNHRTDAFLAHSAVPVVFTDEDFDQVAAGNYLVKVVYLPDPQYQDLAVTGPDEVVSTRLEPGADPIAEAHRRGSILLVVRVGNIDLEAPNTPAMDAPSPYQCKPGVMPPGMMGPAAGMMPPGMMPPGMMPPGVIPPAGMANGPGRPMMMGPNGPMPAMPIPPANGATPASRQVPPPAQRPSGPMTKGPDGPNVQLTRGEVAGTPTSVGAAAISLPTTAATPVVQASAEEPVVKEEPLPKAPAPPKQARSGWNWPWSK